MHDSAEPTGARTARVTALLHAEQPLVSLDRCSIMPEEPDVRGWIVMAEDGHRVGRVDDLLVNRHTGAVQYVLVRLDAAPSPYESRRIVVPVGRARVATQRPQVNLCGVRRFDIAYAPRFRPTLDSALIERVRRFYTRVNARGVVLDDEASLLDERAFWGARRRDREDQPYLVPQLAAGQ